LISARGMAGGSFGFPSSSPLEFQSLWTISPCHGVIACGAKNSAKVGLASFLWRRSLSLVICALADPGPNGDLTGFALIGGYARDGGIEEIVAARGQHMKIEMHGN